MTETDKETLTDLERKIRELNLEKVRLLKSLYLLDESDVKKEWSPGPWALDVDWIWFGKAGTRVKSISVVRWTDKQPDGKELIGVFGTQQGNARLIATAPEMYQALHNLAMSNRILPSRECLEALYVLAKARGDAPDGAS
jgi:hypothetical protein